MVPVTTQEDSGAHLLPTYRARRRQGSQARGVGGDRGGVAWCPGMGLAWAQPSASVSGSRGLRPCRFYLLPGRVHRPADQVIRVGTGSGAELLIAPGINLGDIQVAFLVRADAVHAPQCTREVGHRSP